MTVEIPREEVKEVKRKWGNYTAIFRSSRPEQMDIEPDATLLELKVDISKDPEGFMAFAQAIVDELKANQPPPEKKPRKERKDRGKKKTVLIPLGTGVMGNIHLDEAGVIPKEQADKLMDHFKTQLPGTFVKEVDKEQPRRLITMTGQGDQPHVWIYGDVTAEGKSLKEVCAMLKIALAEKYGGYEVGDDLGWPVDMHPDDLKLVKDIEGGQS